MRLIDYMKKKRLTDEEMAEIVGLGATARSIRNWKYGERTPSVDLIVRFEEVTHGRVRLRDWTQGEHST